MSLFSPIASLPMSLMSPLIKMAVMNSPSISKSSMSLLKSTMSPLISLMSLLISTMSLLMSSMSILQACRNKKIWGGGSLSKNVSQFG